MRILASSAILSLLIVWLLWLFISNAARSDNAATRARIPSSTARLQPPTLPDERKPGTTSGSDADLENGGDEALALVEFRIVDPDDRAIAGARLSYWLLAPQTTDTNGDVQFDSPPQTAMSGNDGRVSISLVGDRYSIRVQHNGYVDSVLEEFHPDPNGRQITIELDVGDVYEAIVRYSNGAPVPHARVTGWCWHDVDGVGYSEAVSDSDGHFALSGLSGDAVEIEVESGDQSLALPELPIVALPRELLLPRGADLVVELRDPQCADDRDATVWFSARPESVDIAGGDPSDKTSLRPLAWDPDRRAYCARDLSPGTRLVRAWSADERRRASDLVELREGCTSLLVLGLTDLPNSSAVTIAVTDREGRALSDVGLQASWFERSRESAFARTADDGNATFEFTPGRAIRIVATKPGYTRAERVIDDVDRQQRIAMTLVSGASFVFRALDSWQEPISNADFTVTRFGDAVDPTNRAARVELPRASWHGDGYRVQDLAGGEYSVTLSVAGAIGDETEPPLSSYYRAMTTESLERVEARQIDYELPTVFELHAPVTLNGLPIDCGTLVLTSDSETTYHRISVAIGTDSIARVPLRLEGEYVVQLATAGRQYEIESLIDRACLTSSFSYSTRKSVLRFVDESGCAIVGAAGTLLGATKREFECDAYGRAHFDALPPGAYEWRLDAGRYDLFDRGRVEIDRDAIDVVVRRAGQVILSDASTPPTNARLILHDGNLALELASLSGQRRAVRLPCGRHRIDYIGSYSRGSIDVVVDPGRDREYAITPISTGKLRVVIGTDRFDSDGIKLLTIDQAEATKSSVHAFGGTWIEVPGIRGDVDVTLQLPGGSVVTRRVAVAVHRVTTVVF